MKELTGSRRRGGRRLDGPGAQRAARGAVRMTGAPLRAAVAESGPGTLGSDPCPPALGPAQPGVSLPRTSVFPQRNGGVQ